MGISVPLPNLVEKAQRLRMQPSRIERENAKLGSQFCRHVHQDHVFRAAEADADTGRIHFEGQGQNLAGMPLGVRFSQFRVSLRLQEA